MDLVPVLAGGNGHIGNCKIFIQLIEGCGTSPSSGGYHRGAYLHTLVEAGAVEKAVQKGNQSTIGRCIINGEPMTIPSLSSNFGAVSFTRSSKTHFPVV